MDDVPFVFCQSVVSLLSFDEYQDNDAFSSTAWQKATATEFKDRINVECWIAFKDGEWSYSLKSRVKYYLSRFSCRSLSFEGFQNLNRRNLGISMFDVGNIIPGQRASFEETTNLVKLALPFVNMTQLNVTCTKDFPQNDHLKLLFYFVNSSIGGVLFEDNSDETWTALGVHLKSDSLKRIGIRDEAILPAEVRPTMMEYVRHSRFTSIVSCYCTLLDMDLFKFLFNKPRQWKLKCKSSIQLEELRDFEKHLQVTSKKEEYDLRVDTLQVADAMRDTNTIRILQNFMNDTTEQLQTVRQLNRELLRYYWPR